MPTCKMFLCASLFFRLQSIVEIQFPRQILKRVITSFCGIHKNLHFYSATESANMGGGGGGGGSMQPLKFVSEIKTIFLEQVFLDWSRNTPALILYFCRVIAWRDPILRNLAKNFNVNFMNGIFFFLLATSIHAPHTHAHTQFLCQFIGWQNSGQLVAPINEHKKLLGADIPD